MKSVEQLVAEAREKAQKKTAANQKLEMHEAAMLHAANMLDKLRKILDKKQ